MGLFNDITFQQVALAFLCCFAVRELMIATLPDSVAGPGGWLIDTGDDV